MTSLLATGLPSTLSFKTPVFASNFTNLSGSRALSKTSFFKRDSDCRKMSPSGRFTSVNKRALGSFFNTKFMSSVKPVTSSSIRLLILTGLPTSSSDKLPIHWFSCIYFAASFLSRNVFLRVVQSRFNLEHVTFKSCKNANLTLSTCSFFALSCSCLFSPRAGLVPVT